MKQINNLFKTIFLKKLPAGAPPRLSLRAPIRVI